MDISERMCVVIGGGEVALRKVKALLECHAKVNVVSPEICNDLDQLGRDGDVTIYRRRYQAGDLNGAVLAIAATDDRDTNQAVSEEARERSIAVNVVDVPASSDFIFPSYFSRGDITIAVSTAGSSPALARKIRTQLEKQVGEEYAVLTRVANDVRKKIKQSGYTVDAERWQSALDLESLLGLIRLGDEDKAAELLFDRLKQEPDGSKT
jgi:siroheme synthase-like protein